MHKNRDRTVTEIIFSETHVLELYEEIGKGGECEVFIGSLRDRRNHRRKICAAKRVKRGTDHPTEAVQRLQLEANVLQLCAHPGIPKFYALLGDPRDPILVEEYFAGKNLWQICKEKGRQSQMDTAVIGMACCDILSYLHSHDPPILYLDLKPGNIIQSDEGKVHLVDFGSCIVRTDRSGDTGTDERFGTLGFAPPEQFYGSEDNRIDQSTDLYALGAVLHMLLCGLEPTRTGLCPIGEFVPDLVGSEMEKIIEKCCSPGSLLRYSSAVELSESLTHCISVEIRSDKSAIFSKIRMLEIVIICTVLWIICIFQYLDSAREYHVLLCRASATEKMSDKYALYSEAICLFPASGEAYLRLLSDLTEDEALTAEDKHLLQTCLYTGGESSGKTLPCVELLEKQNQAMYGQVALEIGWKYLEYSPEDVNYIAYYLGQAEQSMYLNEAEHRRAEIGLTMVKMDVPDLQEIDQLALWRKLQETIGDGLTLEKRCGDVRSAVLLCRKITGYTALQERNLRECGVTKEEMDTLIHNADQYLKQNSVVLGEVEQERA